MEKIIFIGLLVLMPTALWAQVSKPAFHSSIAGGLVVGQSNPSGQLETVNGLRFGQWTAGLGAGIDWYFQRSVPLFVSMQRSFVTKKGVEFFAYANGGYNNVWFEGWQKDRYTDYRGGLYYDLGIGHQMPVFKRHKLFISVGYTVKRYSVTEPSFSSFGLIDWGGVGPGSFNYSDNYYTYNLGRVNLKIGLRL